jgi:hypothetical protein
MPQMPVWRPLGERDLCDELRLEPSASLHRLCRQRQAAARVLRLWQVGEWAPGRLEVGEAGGDLLPRFRREAVADLGDEE